MHRDRERLGGRQPGAELAVDEQRPDVAERDLADEVLDVDAAVAQRTAVLVRLGDLGAERDVALEAGLEARWRRRYVLRSGHCGLLTGLRRPSDGAHGRVRRLPWLASICPGRCREATGVWVASVTERVPATVGSERGMSMAQELAGMRVDYETEGLDVDALAGTWHEQLAKWLAEARRRGLPEANAMVLATASDEGRPSSRTVLCKGVDERGVVFYTNYTSAKSHDLRATRYASATFPWYAQHRQVHLRGPVELVAHEETREVLGDPPAGRAAGGVGVAAVDGRAQPPRARRRAGRGHRPVRRRRPVPVPAHWGGWRLMPGEVEFWQGRANRMHDRLRFASTRTTGAGRCAGWPRDRPAGPRPAAPGRHLGPAPVTRSARSLAGSPGRFEPAGGVRGVPMSGWGGSRVTGWTQRRVVRGRGVATRRPPSDER